MNSVPLVVLLDVDNTLLDNDLVRERLEGRIAEALGEQHAARFWSIYEAVREELREALDQNTYRENRLLTADELAEHLKVPVSWVYEQSRQGNIPTHRLGRYIRFDLREVLASQKKD